MRACSLVPDRFADARHEAIRDGLRAAGLLLTGRAEAAEVLVTWNLHRASVREAAAACERRGGAVIVCEESYTRRLVGEPHIAMALDGHNGSGRWWPGGPERWARLGISLKPWRQDGEHILVCAARGMGSPRMREPRGWAEEVARRLAALSGRPVRLRRHPGKAYAQRPLAEDLAGAWAVVVWASNAATEALAAGIPAFYEAPSIITAGAVQPGLAAIERPAMPERQPVFERLAWAQWSVAEAARGEPFHHLLRDRSQEPGAGKRAKVVLAPDA